MARAFAGSWLLAVVAIAGVGGADVLHVGAGGFATPQAAIDAAGDCRFVGGNGRGGATSNPFGGQPLGSSASGGDGVTPIQARVALHRSIALGGSAGTATAWIADGPTGHGGSGLACAGSFPFSNGASLASALPPQLVGVVGVGGTPSAPLTLPALPPGATDAVCHVPSCSTPPAGAVRLGPSTCVAQIP